MIVYKGKYNVAKVMIDTVDETTEKQIRGFLNHPAFKDANIVIMPDCHAGMGSCIGFTMTMNDYIIPNIVGVDIGCGVFATNLGPDPIDYDCLDQFIRRNIPFGFKHRNQVHMDTKDYYMAGYMGDYSDVCKRLGVDVNSVLMQCGSLGGGNHFIEIDKDLNGNHWLCIHSGSRNFGNRVAKYHQDRAKDLMRKMFVGDAYKNLEFLPLENGGNEYLKDMELAQTFAYYNRLVTARTIVHEFFGQIFKDNFDSVHNYINMEDRVIRKGAIGAHKDETIIIPLNMRDGSIIAKGRGNKDWNNSAPHGAGRILSRKKAKAELSLDEFKSTMEGIYTTCVRQDTLDESPMAYKPIQPLLDVIGETADVIDIIKPVYNFKA